MWQEILREAMPKKDIENTNVFVFGDKVDSSDKEKAEAEIKDLKEALDKNDIDDIKGKKDKLNETAMALATKVYEQAAKDNQQTENKEDKEDKKEKKAKKGDDDVIDAEYEEN